MIDDIAARIPRQGWSAVGGRVMPPADGAVREPAPSGPPGARRDLKGRVSLATADGVLGPGRRLRFRRAHWVRPFVVWMMVVLLAPALVGWVWGLIKVAGGG